MAVKVVFVGNSLAGDDGIGPFLYKDLRDHPKLKDYKMLELGVIGFDLISYIEDDDKLIIVDAIRTKRAIGEVLTFGEKDITADLSIVSQHDLGVEQTAKLLRLTKPGLKQISFVGINVHSISAFTDKLSKEIIEKLQRIKEEVIKNIIKLAEEG